MCVCMCVCVCVWWWWWGSGTSDILALALGLRDASLQRDVHRTSHATQKANVENDFARHQVFKATRKRRSNNKVGCSVNESEQQGVSYPFPFLPLFVTHMRSKDRKKTCELW